MPSTLSYPGVYIEEIPSGVRTITGVATSVTAFIGRAPQGLVSEPITINNFGDFERQFGGLSLNYPMSYAVRDFYLNGGSQALIVRLFKDDSSTGTPGPNAQVTLNELILVASSPGQWGNNLKVSINYDGITQEVADRYHLAITDLFNLVVTYGGSGLEKIPNLSVVEGTRRIDRVLQQESSWLRVGASPLPTARPAIVSGAIMEGGRSGGALGDADYLGSEANKTGLYALKKADLFNLLCIPPDTRDGSTSPSVYQAAMQFCYDHRAMVIVDSPASWGSNKETAAMAARDGLTNLGLSGVAARNAALYFPRVIQADPLREGQLDTFVPCGIVAGVMSRIDTQRGVWKAPAGLDAALNGIQGLQVNLTDPENGMLNPLGINCLRSFPVNGRVLWGARTLRGADQLADEYKYLPVRRFVLYMEESLYRGTQWVVFEPNDEPLWSQIRLNIGAFMNNLFRQGAFQGKSPKDAYFVKCDSETTTQNDINLGIVNIVVGFAPLKPAEFVVIKFQQMAGQIAT